MNSTVVSVEQIKQLREKTGAGIVDCRQALETNKGNFDLAFEYLKRKGLDAAEKKGDRAATDGVIGSYIHSNNKMGVLIEVNCETDFVARTDDFKELVKSLAIHVCAMNPTYVKREEIPGDVLEKELAHFKAEAKTQGKPDNIIEKIAQGKLEKRYADLCLLDQPFVKDPAVTVAEFIKSYIAKLRENVVVRRFVRFELGK